MREAESEDYFVAYAVYLMKKPLTNADGSAYDGGDLEKE